MLRASGGIDKALRCVGTWASPQLGILRSNRAIRSGIPIFQGVNQVRTVKTLTIDWTPLKAKVGDVAEAERQKKLPVFRKFLLGLMIAMPVVAFALGCWQVKRLNWKMELISKAEDALAQPAIEALPKTLDPNVIPEFEYRKFKVSGHFDYSQEMFLGPRIRNGALGYIVICPFVRSDGGEPILIERGWILKDKVVPETRQGGYLEHMSMPRGDIEIEALFRVMPGRSSLQFEHEQGSRLFHVPDVEAMARQANCLPIYCQMIYSLKDRTDWRTKQKKNSSWKDVFSWREYSKDEEAELLGSDSDSTLEYQEFEFIDQGVPLAPTPKVKYSNNHLQYLITWFSLSVVSAGLLLYNLFKKKQYLSAEKVIQAKRDDMKRMW